MVVEEEEYRDGQREKAADVCVTLGRMGRGGEGLKRGEEKMEKKKRDVL